MPGALDSLFKSVAKSVVADLGKSLDTTIAYTRKTGATYNTSTGALTTTDASYSFNAPIDHWLDFFCFTHFIDRDGKYQLKMLSTSSFKPLAASMGPMLKEESFHLGTGANGLRRIVKQGVIPCELLQKYLIGIVSF